jgi:tellurite resistance protein TerC
MTGLRGLAVQLRAAVRAWFGKYKRLRKIVIGMLGASILIIGVFMLVLPGPAVLVVPVGLAVLATEFAWARRLLQRLKQKFADGSEPIRNRSSRD